MRKEYVDTPLAILGSKSHIRYEPKGNVLIISPWNFPINLTLGPLVSAIAAGNTVILKPSEHTSHAGAIMSKILKEVFTEEDGWTVRTVDGKPSVHFEHDICVQKGKADILSDFSIIEAAEKKNSELFSDY